MGDVLKVAFENRDERAKPCLTCRYFVPDQGIISAAVRRWLRLPPPALAISFAKCGAHAMHASIARSFDCHGDDWPA